MRMMVLITLIVCGAFGTAGNDAQNADLTLQLRHAAVSELLEAKPLANYNEISAIDERKADEAAEPASGEEVELQLDTVSGISLYDSKDEVYRKLGAPLQIEQDEIYSDMEVYHYEGLHIAFAGDFLQYVDVEMSRELIIDDQEVEATLDGLVEALGDPDFTAEDGFVFQRDDALIKLFTDQETGEPLYVSFYHIATV